MQTLQIISNIIVAIAGLCGAILGIQKFFDTYTQKGKELYEIKQKRKTERFYQIAKDTVKESLEQFRQEYQVKFQEILDKLSKTDEALENLNTVNSQQNKLFNQLNQKIDMNEIDRIRHEILYFASQCRHQIQFSPDDFQHIFKLHDKYEQLLSNNGMTNGQMDIDFNFIIEYYNNLNIQN